MHIRIGEPVFVAFDCSFCVVIDGSILPQNSEVIFERLLSELTHYSAAGDLLARYAYTLDALGQRIQVQEGAYAIYLPLVLRRNALNRQITATPDAATQTTPPSRLLIYRYDPLNRLVAADYATGEHFAYRYDAVGNRLTLTETTPLSGTVISTHSYDAVNRLMERNVSDGRAYTYTWSARGQLLTEWTRGIPVRTFGYNGAGQMVAATVFTLTTQFSYNGDGGRVGVNVVGHGATHITLDAGGQRVLAETTLTDTVQYIYGDDCLYIYGDDCLGEYRAGEWLYYLNDGSGYVRQGVGDQGEVVSSWLFDPSGIVLEGPEGPVSHLICGGVYDWSTGLLHKNGSYFDPRLGIWLLLAPLVVVQGWNRKRRKYPWVVLVFLVVGVSGMLAACSGTVQVPTPMPTLTCTEIATLWPTLTPTAYPTSLPVSLSTPDTRAFPSPTPTLPVPACTPTAAEPYCINPFADSEQTMIAHVILQEGGSVVVTY